MEEKSIYKEAKPKKELAHLVHSFWMHQNLTDTAEKTTIVPDSFLKIIIMVKDKAVIAYFLTGLWTAEKTIAIPPKTTTYGCRLKILAPEFLLQKALGGLCNKSEPLPLHFLNTSQFLDLNFENLVLQWQKELQIIVSQKTIPDHKLKLSLLVDALQKNISTKSIAAQIHWSNRQINRYLNKYLGLSLKKYLNIKKCYRAYAQIKAGEFYPEKGYFDQAHFIRTIKKHTGQTPKALYKQQNDHFIQLKRSSGE